MSEEHVILHHYPQSPVSEKVRVVLGMKGLAWASVIIPRLPPKPNLMPLTGGYRLTPVMQIGADVYCDTHCILREIERRFPKPALVPTEGAGLVWGLAQWTDGPFFKDVVTVALVEMSPSMPPEFLADRGPLYFGADFSLDAIKARYDEALANIRAQLGWVEASLAGRDYLSGDAPGLADALIYYLVWFLGDRMADGAGFLGTFPRVTAWAARVRAIGHGAPASLGDEEALAVAAGAEPASEGGVDPDDPSGLAGGETVGVAPVVGGVQVVGSLHGLGPDRVALMRDDARVGRVCVHFPRIGYRLSRV
jgi:glutathione S-transferase